MNLENMTTEQLEKLLNDRKQKEQAEKDLKRTSYESLRYQTIQKLVPMASAISNELKNFKRLVRDEMNALYSVLQEYSSRYQDGKGSFTVEDADMRIKYRIHEYGNFDERSKMAIAKINDFITRKFSDDKDTFDVISALLKRTKGRLDINQIQTLYKFEERWTDTDWREGIALLKESWQPTEAKWYVQFEIKQGDAWVQIPLDFASMNVPPSAIVKPLKAVA